MLLLVRPTFALSLSSSFTVLGLQNSCKMVDIKRKYYELAKTCHPDVNKADSNAHRRFD